MFATRRWLLPVTLLLLGIGVYANSFPGCFILDDLPIVRDNPLVAQLDFLVTLRSDYWYPFDSTGLFRPLTILSLALNRLLLGPDPWGFHLVNVLLHGLAVVLVWCVLRCWGLVQRSAVVAAVAFAWHPIHGEVVNVVVGRSELLVACCLLGSLWLYRQPGRGAQIGVGLCYLLALGAKEHAIVFIAILLLWSLFTDGFVAVTRRWPLYLGLMVVTVGWLLWRQFGIINPLPQVPLTEAAAPLAFVDASTRVLSALRIQGLYLGRLISATGMQTTYSPAEIPLVGSLFSLAGLATVGAAVAAALLVIVGWRRRTRLALLVLLYFVAFLPTSNLLFPIGVSVAERLAYLPSVWFCAALGLAVESGSTARRWYTGGVWLVCCYLLWLGVMGWQRNSDYRSAEQLWRVEVRNHPDDYLGWHHLASSLAAAGNDAEAEIAYHRALAIAPEYPAGLRSLANYYLARGRVAEALPLAQKTYGLSVTANDLVATAFDALTLATVAVSSGDGGGALAYIDGPARMLQDQVRAREVRGVALSMLGRDAEAVESFSGLQLDPGNYRLQLAYGKSLLVVGQGEAARRHLTAAVVGVEDAEGWNLLGVACMRLGDREPAIEAFERAVYLEPQNLIYLNNLNGARKATAERGQR